MTPEQFHSWIKDPASVRTEDIPKLREVTQRYPYFQAAQMLLAYALHRHNHIDKQEQLQRTALMVPDRKLLFDLLHDRIPAHEVATETPQAEQEQTPAKSTSPKEEPASTQETEKPEIQTEGEHLLPDELIPDRVVYRIEDVLPDDAQEPQEKAPEAEPAHPEKPVGEMSFIKWLDLLESGSLNENDRAKPTGHEEETPNSLRSNIELIEGFLNRPTESRQKRAEFFNPQKAAAKSQHEDFTFVSETLANIYVQQGKLDLARKAYEALSLKYPEKSSYFAARLKELDDNESDT